MNEIKTKVSALPQRGPFDLEPVMKEVAGFLPQAADGGIDDWLHVYQLKPTNQFAG